MDPVAEERARLYRGRYPTDKRLSVLEFIERSLGIYLQRLLRVHSQVLMESADIPYTAGHTVSLGFISRASSPIRPG